MDNLSVTMKLVVLNIVAAVGIIVLGIVGIVLFVYSAGMFVNTVFRAELSKILGQLTPV